MGPLLYAAYGSNLDHARMRARCPGARPAGAQLLPGWRLRLGRFATILPDPESAVPVGIWAVTEGHLHALDLAEGTARGVYSRALLDLPRPVEGSGQAWIYVERLERAGPPAPWYVAHLVQGYRDFGLDPAPLEAALAELMPG